MDKTFHGRKFEEYSHILILAKDPQDRFFLLDLRLDAFDRRFNSPLGKAIKKSGGHLPKEADTFNMLGIELFAKHIPKPKKVDLIVPVDRAFLLAHTDEDYELITAMVVFEQSKAIHAV